MNLKRRELESVWLSKALSDPRLAGWRPAGVLFNRTRFEADCEDLDAAMSGGSDPYASRRSDEEFYETATGSEAVEIKEVFEHKFSDDVESINRRTLLFSVQCGEDERIFAVELAPIFDPDMSNLRDVCVYIEEGLGSKNREEWHDLLSQAVHGSLNQRGASALLPDPKLHSSIGGGWERYAVDREAPPDGLNRGLGLSLQDWRFLINDGGLQGNPARRLLDLVPPGAAREVVAGWLSIVADNAYRLGRRVREVEIAREFGTSVKANKANKTGGKKGGATRGLRSSNQREAILQEMLRYYAPLLAGAERPMSYSDVAKFMVENWPGFKGPEYPQSSPYDPIYLEKNVIPELVRLGLKWPRKRAGRSSKSTFATASK